MFKYKCMSFTWDIFVFQYKCMHLFSNTKCIFKYKCMHINARGYGSLIMVIFYKYARFDNMKVNDFKILLIDIQSTMILSNVLKVTTLYLPWTSKNAIWLTPNVRHRSMTLIGYRFCVLLPCSEFTRTSHHVIPKQDNPIQEVYSGVWNIYRMAGVHPILHIITKLINST